MLFLRAYDPVPDHSCCRLQSGLSCCRCLTLPFKLQCIQIFALKLSRVDQADQFVEGQIIELT